ncbi:MAG: flagellar motor switch protein FliM [Thermodesulfovibrionales bacterium]
MSDKVLSQDEVDAILGGVESGEIATETAAGSPEGVKPYDFKAQERIIRGRMPGLELANDRFTRLFRNSLSSIIMKFIDVRIHNVEMMAFSEFMKTLPLPSSINLFKMDPLKGFALFVIEAPMVFGFIEYFFGGGAKPYVKSEGRYFTPIEQRMIKKVAALALRDMAASWSGLAPIKPEYVGLEMNPQFVTIVTGSESVIKIEIEIEVEDFTGRASFCIPYSMVEPIKEKLYSGIQDDRQDTDHRWVEGLKHILGRSYARVRVEMGTAELTVRELMGLEPGNIITLGKSVSDDLVVRVEGVPKFAGVPGYSKGNQAVKIRKILRR